MSFERNPNVDMTGARTVTLAGREFTVPPLSLRQSLSIIDFIPTISGSDVKDFRGERLKAVSEVIWRGLSRAYPDLTHDEFFDMQITMAELADAVSVVLSQARRPDPVESAAAA